MMNIDIATLERAIGRARATLKEGFLATDIWDVNTGLSLAGVDQRPTAVALMNDILNDLQQTLFAAEWPGIGRFVTIELQDDLMILMIRYGDQLRQGMLVDLSKTSLGLVLNVAVPRLVEDIESMRVPA